MFIHKHQVILRIQKIRVSLGNIYGNPYLLKRENTDLNIRKIRKGNRMNASAFHYLWAQGLFHKFSNLHSPYGSCN